MITFDIAAQRARLTPDKVAFHEVTTGQTITYRQLDERACRFAEALVRAGHRAGERIAILSHNRAAFFEILLGCAKARVILVPLNWRLTTSELVPLLDDCGATVLFHDAPTAELADSLAGQRELALIRVLDHGEAVAAGTYQALLAESSGSFASDQVWPEDQVWYLLYTSGTTGVPKAVIQTVGMAWANYVNIGQAVDLGARDATPNYLPLFHTAGINLHTLPTLIAGGTVKVIPGFDPELFLDLVDRGEITALLAVPAVYQALSLHERFATTELGKVRSWAAGGAPLPDAVVGRYAERGVTLCQGYGMTETGPTVFLVDQDNAMAKLGSVGKPQILTQVRVVDERGNDLPAGQAGELLIKGPNVTPGYWNRPQATAEALDAEGWLHTGDVARADQDGYYYIVDRIKDMYISGGENVYPAEVENVLCSHPDVLEAAVVGVPDAKWGEAGCAFLIPRPERTPVPDQVLAFCRERLAGYKIPKRIEIREDFPRTPAGKVQKHVLKADYLERT